MSLPVLSDSLQNYLVQINRFPLLTQEEEFNLAVRYSKYNDLSAAHKLVTSNLKFVVKIALEYRGYLARYTENAVKLTDLIQEGNIGLMKAVKRFDPHKGYRLITYAVWWIRAQIQQFILKTLNIVKKSTSELRKIFSSQLTRTNEMIEKIGSKTSPSKRQDGLPRLDGLNLETKETGLLHLEHETSNMPSNLHHVSLDREVGEEGDVTFLDTLPDHSKNQEEALMLKEDNLLTRKRLKEALETLNHKEKTVITYRFLQENPLTLQEIGDKLGITRERVRQIEGKALGKLKRHLERKSLAMPGARTRLPA